MAEIRVDLILKSNSYVQGMKEASKSNSEFGKSAEQSTAGVIKNLSDVEKAAVKAGQEMRKRLSTQTGYKGGAAENLVSGIFGYNAEKAQEKFNRGAIASAESAARKQATAKLREYEKGLKQEEAAARKSAAKTAKETAAETAASQYARMAGTFRSSDFDSKLASTRYALYDVGRRFIALGVAIGATAVQAVQAAGRFESAFTSVERTSRAAGDELELLRQNLIDISTTLPIAFEDVAAIATLGAQMGISNDALDEFTTTVSKFSTITGITVEQTAQSFGRLAQLMNVPVSQFENLSSAITFAGINAVATDAEILKMSESIAAASTQAGFSADEVIGLATALASLKVRPEEARGVLVRLFRTIDLEVSRGGERLNDFATVIGKTSEEASNLWKQDPSQFVQSFLRGAAAGGELNQVITALGITNSRELNVIQRLAGNMDVLTGSLADAKQQYDEASYSTEAYAKVADDLAQKLQVLQNNIAALQAEMGAAFGEALKPMIDLLTTIINGFTKLPQPILTTVAALTGIAGIFIVFKGAIAVSIAGLFAMRLALTNLGISSVGAGLNLRTLSAALLAVGRDASIGGRAITFLAGALNKAGLAGGFLSKSLGWIGLIATAGVAIATVFSSMEAGAEKAKNATFEAAGGAQALMDALAADRGSTSEVYGKIEVATQKLTEEEENHTRALLQTRIEQARASRETETGKKAYEDALAALDSFNKKMESQSGLLDTNSQSMKENTRQLLINALAQYGENGVNFWSQLGEIDAKDRALLESAGFDSMEFIAAGMRGNAQKYVSDVFRILNDSMPASEFYSDSFQVGVRVISEAAKEADSWKSSADNAAAAWQEMEAAGGSTTPILEENNDEMQLLNDEIRDHIALLTAIPSRENAVADAYSRLAEAAIENGGAVNGLTEAARTNLGNFEAFMKQATEAAIAAGEGMPGAFKRIVDGLTSLEEQGVNTSEMLSIFKGVALDSLLSVAPALKQIYDELNASQSLQGMRDAISAFYALKIAAAATPSEVFALKRQLEDALSALTGFGTNYTVTFNRATKSTEKVQTALEKLRDLISNAFKYTNLYADVQAGLNSLGESLAQNGKDFTVYSEAGRDNISALGQVIDALAAKSGGNVTKFANDLASLRAALVKAGAPASALKIIDSVTKQIGKTGKASAKDVKQFETALKKVGETKRELYAVKDAMDAIASGLRQGFEAVFAQANAIDAVTLGWLDMADAADNARKSISDAGNDISDARVEIENLNAEIQGLAADKGKLEYQLSIALKYGDSMRANQIRADLAKIDADVADKQNSILDANQKITDANAQITEAQGVLGNSPSVRQQIERNNALRDMALRYGDVAAAQIAAAPAGTDLNKIVEDQVTAFKDSALQMGYSETEASDMADVLRDELIYQMSQIPKDITTDITAETSVATKAVSDFVNYANSRLEQIKDKTITVTTKYATQVPTPTKYGGGGGGFVAMSTGGFVSGPGSSTSDSIAARLSNGEYVIKAAAVSKYGVDFFNSLNQMKTAPAGMASGIAQQQSGGGMVYLSPEDRQLLRAAIDRPIALYTDNATIATSANNGNKILAQRGIK